MTSSCCLQVLNCFDGGVDVWAYRQYYATYYMECMDVLMTGFWQFSQQMNSEWIFFGK